MNTSLTNAKERTANTRNLQANLSPKKLASKNLRFPQAKLLVLITRRIIHSRIRTAYDKVKVVQRRKFYRLNIINTIWSIKKKDAFLNILSRSKQNKLLSLKSKTSRVNIRIFLIQMLERLYQKKLHLGFNSISNCLIKNNLLSSKVSELANLLQKIGQNSKKKFAWRKIVSISQKRRLIIVRMVFFQQIFHKTYNKTMKNTLQTLFVYSSHMIYEDLFISSQSKRKLCYDVENNRRQLLINERQSIYSLKQMIESEAYDKNVKNAQMKRDRAIKISQTQQKIKQLQRELETRQMQILQTEKNASNANKIIEKRANLSKISKGSRQKVNSLFNSVKYEEEAKIIRSSTLIAKIVLNKEKFKSLLQQYDSIRTEIEDFEIFTNTKYRNLVCAYENVQMDSLKQSKEYEKAFDEHSSLTQFLNSLFRYDLLKDKGDGLLKQSIQELESHFEQIFGQMQQNQVGGMDQDVRSSITSLKSSKVLKKRSSLKASSVNDKFSQFSSQSQTKY